MSAESHDKSWQGEDFQRYYAGDMSATERHALERAALDDPFLADALEGYALSSQPSATLNELKEKIAERKKGQAIAWYQYRPPIQALKIAALLVVFFTIAWLLQRNFNNTEKTLATVEQKSAPVSDLPPAVGAGDTSLPDSTRVAVYAPAATLTPGTMDVSEARAHAEKPITADFARDSVQALSGDTVQSTREAAAIETVELFAREKKSAAAPVTNKALEGKVSGISIRNQNAIRGRVVDTGGHPVAFANINDTENKLLLAADQNGFFQLNNQNNAANVRVDVKAAGYESNKVALSPGSLENKVVLQKSDAALSEVVVTGYGTKRKSAGAVSSRKQVHSVNDGTITAGFFNILPVSGWNQLNRFIADSVSKNFFYLPLLREHKVLTFHFELDSTGRAITVETTKPLPVSSSQILISLIQSLPALKKKTASKKARLTLRYLPSPS